MARPITLLTIQWADLPLAEIAQKAKRQGNAPAYAAAARRDQRGFAAQPAIHA